MSAPVGATLALLAEAAAAAADAERFRSGMKLAADPLPSPGPQ